MRIGCVGVMLLLLAALESRAESAQPEFGLPLDCSPGVDCWVANYVDRIRSPDANDYTCGTLSYDGHQGTDFALRDMAAVRAGVNVLAVAPGTVLRRRDGEPEGMSEAHRAQARSRERECGNGVVIDHGEGWNTQYCHMKQGSIAVEAGQKIEAGQAIGQVGVSGVTEFPHLHLKVEYRGLLMDPFTGTEAGSTCGESTERSLWSESARQALSYRRGQIFNAGFSPGSPDLEQVRDGSARPAELACESQALVTWMEAFGVHQGDRFSMKLMDEAGRVLLDKEEVLERTQARIFRFGGKRLRADCWPSGRYTAEFRLRDGSDDAVELSSMQVTVEIVALERSAE